MRGNHGFIHARPTLRVRARARKRVYLCHDARERADISRVAVQTASLQVGLKV